MYNITKILHIPVFFCDTLFTFTVRKSFIFKIIEFLILKTLTVTLIVFHYFFQNKLVDNQTTWYICCDIIYLTSIVEKKEKKIVSLFLVLISITGICECAVTWQQIVHLCTNVLWHSLPTVTHLTPLSTPSSSWPQQNCFTNYSKIIQNYGKKMTWKSVFNSDQ